MFEKFTAEARRVVILAQEEARSLGHDFIGPEHLLIPLTTAGVAGEILTSLGVMPDDVRSGVADILCLGAASPTGYIPFSPSAVRVLERANMVRLATKTPRVEPEHILLALATFGELSAELYVRLGLKQSNLHVVTTGRLSFPESEAEVPAGRTFDVHVSTRGTVHLDAHSAAHQSRDGSSHRGQLTLADGEYFGMTRGNGDVIQAARFLDYRMARDAAEAAGCGVVIMTPGTEDISALEANGKTVTIGTATVFTASLLSDRLTITG